MLVDDGTGNVQSLNTACITLNAIFSHFIFDEKQKKLNGFNPKVIGYIIAILSAS